MRRGRAPSRELSGSVATLAQVAVSVQARVGLGLILLQERRFPVSVFYLSDWSERKGLSFHFATWLWFRAGETSSCCRILV